MKSLLLALGIVGALGALLFGIFHAMGVVDKVAGPLAGAALGFFTFIHDKVDKALSSGGSSRLTPGIVPVDEFTLRWPWMLLYATFTLMAMSEIVALTYSLPALAIIRMMAGTTPPFHLTPEQFGMAILGLLLMPSMGWCLFLLGRWVGVRSARQGYWIFPLTILLGRGLEILMVYASGPRERAMFHALVHNPNILPALFITPLLMIGVGLLGVWRGNMVRPGAYFNSLLKRVSEPTRAALLAMTFEEAKAAAPVVEAVAAVAPLRT